MNRVQDIHQSDDYLWKSFQMLWMQGRYQDALDFLEDNIELQTKINNAEYMNLVQDWLVDLQQTSDPTFKADRIQVADTPPVLQNGEVYFQLI